MSVGLNPSKSEIDTMAGVIARDVQSALNRVRDFQYFLAGKSDADLIASGYLQAEVDVLRSAYADLVQLTAIYTGAGPLAAAKDFRTFVRRIFGMGAV